MIVKDWDFIDNEQIKVLLKDNCTRIVRLPMQVQETIKHQTITRKYQTIDQYLRSSIGSYSKNGN